MKKAMTVVLVIVVLVAVAELSAPYLISRGLEMGLNRTLGSDVSVRLKAYPSLRLLMGKFDSVSVIAKNVNLGGLAVSEYAIVAQEVEVNMRELLARRELKFVNQGKLEVQVTIAEADLSQYLWGSLPELKGWRVQVNTGNVTVIGQTPILNATMDVKIHGHFAAADTTKLAFVPESVEINNAILPKEIVDAALNAVEFYIDLAAAPMPLELIEAKMEPGKLILRAKVLQ